jgi:hypothetical protein
MNCYKCKYEFCWICLGHYKSYRHDPGMDEHHHLSEGVYIAIYTTIALMFVFKVMIYTYGNDLSQIGSRDFIEEISASDSLFTFKNIVTIVLAFIFINIVAFITGIMVVVMFETRWIPKILCPAPFIVVFILLQMSNASQFAFHLGVFELLLITFLFSGFWCGLGLLIVGTISLLLK